MTSSAGGGVVPDSNPHERWLRTVAERLYKQQRDYDIANTCEEAADAIGVLTSQLATLTEKLAASRKQIKGTHRPRGHQFAAHAMNWNERCVDCGAVDTEMEHAPCDAATASVATLTAELAEARKQVTALSRIDEKGIGHDDALSAIAAHVHEIQVLCDSFGYDPSEFLQNEVANELDVDDAATSREAALRQALGECEDYFDNRADVKDGSYGEPAPNDEMRMLQVVRQALAGKGEKSVTQTMPRQRIERCPHGVHPDNRCHKCD